MMMIITIMMTIMILSGSGMNEVWSGDINQILSQTAPTMGINHHRHGHHHYHHHFIVYHHHFIVITGILEVS